MRRKRSFATGKCLWRLMRSMMPRGLISTPFLPTELALHRPFEVQRLS